jgi:hypothetical protein
MDRAPIERWTDTDGFRIALGLSGVLVVPVLALGLAVSAVMLVVAVAEQTAEFAGAVVVALSLGGVAGLLGVLRARYAVRSPGTNDVTATLVCLAIVTATALAAAVIVAYPSVSMLGTWSSPVRTWPGLLVVAAHVVWVLFGVGRMHAVSRRYAEGTGRAFDGIPATMLFIAIALAVAATLIASSL